MTENKPQLMKTMWEALNASTISSADGEHRVELNKILTPVQMHDVVLTAMNCLPDSSMEQVRKFHEAFKVEREESHQIDQFKFAKLRFELILEELLELGLALGFGKGEMYQMLMTRYREIPEFSEVGIVPVADALIDLKFVVNGAVDVFNLTHVAQKLMEEVTSSNMSKLIPVDDYYLDVIKDTVADYKAQGIDIETVDLKNGYFCVRNKHTKKILKPTTYHLPKLEPIINNK